MRPQSFMLAAWASSKGTKHRWPCSRHRKSCDGDRDSSKKKDVTDEAGGEESVAAKSGRERDNPHPRQNLKDHMPGSHIGNMPKRA